MEIIEKRMKKVLETYKSNNSTLVGLLYSGGLDSSIVAKLLLSVFSVESIKAITIGLPNSYDLRNAAIGAQELGIELYKYHVNEKIVMDAIDNLKDLKIIHSPGDLSIAVPLYIGMKCLTTRYSVTNVFLGQGADELFGGYQKYLHMYEEKGQTYVKSAMIKDLEKLMNNQMVMEGQIADYFGIHLVYLFLDPEIISYAQSQSVVSHIVQTKNGSFIRKALLRNFAMNLGLPKSITEQPKKAIQYGSGIVKLLRKISKNEGYQSVHAWFQDYFSV